MGYQRAFIQIKAEISSPRIHTIQREIKLALDIMIGVPAEEKYNLYGDFASNF